MKIRPDQLPKQLAQGLAPVIMVEGEETLLCIEAADRVRAAARAAGYEREVLDAGPGFDWGQLIEARSGLSLFATLTLLELRLVKGKLDAKAEKALTFYLDDPSPEKCLLITAPKLEPSQTKKGWFKQVEQQGWHVSCAKIYSDKFGAWLKGELRNQGVALTDEGFDALMLRVEGNALAARQEIQKLHLFFQGQPMSDLDVAKITAESARYTVFELTDACLDGKVAKVDHILSVLEAEGAAPLGILRLIARDLSMLTDIQSHPNGIRAGAQSAPTIANKRPKLERAANRLSANALLSLNQQALRVDRAVKGQNKTPAWLSLSQLALKIAGARTPAS
ncbi:DNA polymerase III subunit delta [Litorivicinus lipolyticus]|uniref:DNA polymerase III subunit delta n=1 Tax=Litorivicinus lipolyticus TaxID=418701 RepID=A0A5Q2QJ01_9GAMM|nr:DNA polymerase III subunit delta [Litorivicinus lipolyticus]QGG81035.1 DNA polymerase III subunit delta [Litorivicinus lipolyticus]